MPTELTKRNEVVHISQERISIGRAEYSGGRDVLMRSCISLIVCCMGISHSMAWLVLATQ